DHLASLASKDSFAGLQSPLNDYKGKLYKLDIADLLAQTKQPEAPKPATMLNVAKGKLTALDKKPVLLLDHLEAMYDARLIAGISDKDLDALRVEIAHRGPLLLFGIYRALGDISDHLLKARLGQDNIKTLPFRPYGPQQTKALFDDGSFFMHLRKNHVWKQMNPENPGRVLTFAKDAFDLLIALEPGAWHDHQHKVLPGLVIDLTQDAMETAARGEHALRDTVNCALDAFKELRRDELPHTKYRDPFEPLLKQAEEA